MRVLIGSPTEPGAPDKGSAVKNGRKGMSRATNLIDVSRPVAHCCSRRWLSPSDLRKLAFGPCSKPLGGVTAPPGVFFVVQPEYPVWGTGDAGPTDS